MKKLSILPLVSAILILFSACEKKIAESPAGESFKVGTWKTAQTIQPFFYSQFSGQDSVEVLPFTNPGDQKTALLAGSLDLTGTTLVTAIAAAAAGEPIVIVAGLCNKCSALAVGNNSNIEKESDLRGKTIAYVPGTMHHILLLDVLRRNNIDPGSEVKLIRIDFFDMGQALARGAIDAFLSGEPYPTNAEMDGYGRILSYPYFDESIGSINAAMITTKEQIEKHPERIRKLVNMHIKSTEYLLKNKEAWLDKAAEFGTEPNILKKSSENIELFYKIDKPFIERAKRLAEEMYKLEIIPNIPDVEKMFDLRFIN